MTTTTSTAPVPGTAPGVDAGTAGQAARTDALVERLFGSVLAAMDLQAVYLGDRLGYYRALAGAGPLTSTELAARTGTAERYAREWLEQQAVTGLLDAHDDDASRQDPLRRRFSLPWASVEPLTDELSPNFLVPLARFVVGGGKHVDALVQAHRTGGGVSWEQMGADAREAQAAANRPLFLGALGREHLPSIPDVDAALRRGGRVADIGCGFGWSSIGIALAYPEATVDGYDVDGPSIEAARRNAAEAGVADRVRFSVADVAAGTDGGAYDVVAAFECIHDLPDPVTVLREMRRLAGDDGFVLVMDERVAESFGAPGDEIERLMYGYSLLCCLADGMSTQPSVATGTVMRPDTLRRYAREAGFRDVEVLDVADDFFRFYRLVSG
ncbi:class I SAM-dependent methyltransferase [Geodermatophilus sp. YIM 151500]|uniref:class I SAM-dependent methyltransferase n=1 Tax=Geodermatophilus sp. YIM 151500 TaxID=2984531 RepID=UPI0021E3AFF2|nr:class I SAM-dependent methyltransferase [Geodermatophilus sp. YIM 151500]MCV2490915.1 class I SAM-dependent methyltransferase [Geodermatophilus sp. YIM 151500]